MVDASFSLFRRRPRFGPARRRQAALVAGSVLFHLAILSPLALRLFEHSVPVNEAAYDTPIFIEMEPRPLIAGEAPRVAATPITHEATPTVGDVRTSPAATPTMPGQTETLPSPIAPHLASSAPTEAAAAADAWRVTPETMQAAVARSLRTGPVGCRAMDGRLSAGEQQLCDDRFNEAAARAGPLGPRTLTASEARRQAGFARDGTRALAQYEARRRPLSGGVGIIGVGDCPGSNLGVGCAGAHLDPAIRQGATTVGNPGLGSNDLKPMRPIAGNE